MPGFRSPLQTLPESRAAFNRQKHCRKISLDIQMTYNYLSYGYVHQMNNVSE